MFEDVVGEIVVFNECVQHVCHRCCSSLLIQLQCSVYLLKKSMNSFEETEYFVSPAFNFGRCLLILANSGPLEVIDELDLHFQT